MLYNCPVTWVVQFLAGASVAVRTIGSHCWVHGQAGYLHQFTIFIRSRLQLIFSTDYSLNFEQITFHILSNTVIILRRVQLKVVKKIKNKERLKGWNWSALSTWNTMADMHCQPQKICQKVFHYVFCLSYSCSETKSILVLEIWRLWSRPAYYGDQTN